jgi:hypothetical protein
MKPFTSIPIDLSRVVSISFSNKDESEYRYVRAVLP